MNQIALAFAFGGMLVTYFYRKYQTRNENMIAQIKFEIWSIDWELDELVERYSRALSGPSSPEVPSKTALSNSFAKEKAQLHQQKRRLEKKLHELELKG